MDLIKQIVETTNDAAQEQIPAPGDVLHDGKIGKLSEAMHRSLKFTRLEQALYVSLEYQGDSPEASKQFVDAYNAMKAEVGDDKAKVILAAMKRDYKQRTKSGQAARAKPERRTGMVEAASGMNFKLDIGKHEPARANYPKTNLKRSMDEWNDKMGRWATTHKKAGHSLMQRHTGGKLVVDAIGDDGLVSTAVVSNDGELHNDMTFDFYNHSLGQQNAYSNPEKHEGEWTYKPMSMDDLHYSDQRNSPTTKNATVKKRGRKKDGTSLQALARSSRKD